MEKRMIVAIGLSLLILFGFQMLGSKPEPHVERITPLKQTTYSDTPSSPQVKAVRQDSGVELKEIEVDPRTEEKTTIIERGKTKVVFSDRGGSIKEILLGAEHDPEAGKEQVYSQEDPGKRMFAMTMDLLGGLDKAKFTQKKGPDFVEYTYIEEEWLKVSKKFQFTQKEYEMLVEVKIENLSIGKRDLSYALIGPGSIQQADGVSGRSFIEVNTLMEGKIWKVAKAKGSQERKGPISWTAIKNRYHGMILKPEAATREVVVKDEGKGNLLTEIEMGGWTLSPGTEIKQEYTFYAGPLNEKVIAGVSEDMTPVVNYGFFGGVSKILLVVLRFFYGITGNWGLSIILLTFTVNLLLFPLAVKSFISMHQMKKIQPHIMKLKELHKDNPQKLNKETMELYKKNNVNPLGGCLPLLLQMPIFIALYQGLIRSIELKGSAFLWIKDLSRPDAVPIPMTLPLVGNTINILPLLMVVMMALQQKMTQASSSKDMTEEQKSQQKMMMLMMPVIFGFMFYGMPSGLVLYWLTNTILMTTGQRIISSRLEA
jgi:YidC/Oxa1 family membrane protein insertase